MRRFLRIHFTSSLKHVWQFVFLSALTLGPFAFLVSAQPNLSGEGEIRQDLEQLSTLGSVMMIGAHPDDENSALLAYFSRGRHVRTAYLSLTRGEGGQNLLGPEQGDQLGIIRTEELLDARRIDGAEQYFTRAIDFGFSKTAAETFTKWPREDLLGDIVWDIRRFRPDVIILRFSGTPRDGHGQHQVSAILGKEAFSVAADPTKYPEQLKYVQPWQAKRLMYNVIAFTAQQEKEAQKMADRIELDLGAYNPELGYSYGEIAGMSRSQHRSQGMGVPEQKGSQKNYLVTIAGDKAMNDPFDGIDLKWSRLPGGDAIGPVIEKALADFAPAHPESLLPALTGVRAKIAAIHDPMAEFKLKQLEETIAQCAALWLDANADRYAVTPGGRVKINLTALARQPERVTLLGADLSGMEGLPTPDLAQAVLVDNQPNQYSIPVRVPEDQPYSQPYWLVQPRHGWMYTVADQQLVGDPENPPVLEAHFRTRIDGVAIEFTRPVEYRYVDHLYGELTRPLAIVPPAGVGFLEKALMFPTSAARHIEVAVHATTGKVSGDVQLEAPNGWTISPASQHFDLAAEQQSTVAFDVTPPSADAETELRATAEVGDRKISVGYVVISYPHIRAQTLFPPASTRIVRADIRLLSKHIGYVMGAGDNVPDALRQMGATVALLSPENLASGDLSSYDAIVTGVRAWNVRLDLRANYQRLYDYVSNGGALIVQYNVPEDGFFGGDPTLLEHIGPYPITLSHDRVADEDAPVTFPHPENPLLHSPNAIAEKDFAGWVQERGLNFASQWDPRYETVLECHDPGEEPLAGGELYTRLGKGAYVFSAYSWFRELPAGVAGAYRLFANMLDAAKSAQ